MSRADVQVLRNLISSPPKVQVVAYRSNTSEGWLPLARLRSRTRGRPDVSFCAYEPPAASYKAWLKLVEDNRQHRQRSGRHASRAQHDRDGLLVRAAHGRLRALLVRDAPQRPAVDEGEAGRPVGGANIWVSRAIVVMEGCRGRDLDGRELVAMTCCSG